MRKILTVTLASALLIASSSAVFAGMNGRDPSNGFGTHNNFGAGFNDKSRSSEQQQLFQLDYGTTGSISNCDIGYVDRHGNCVVNPGYQPMR